MLSLLSSFLEHGYLSPLTLSILLLGLAITAFGIRKLYRLYLHPLARFSGPKRAAVSNDWLYQISRNGQPEKDIELLHDKYKTKCLRIAPNKLHISDVHLYKTIYSQTAPYLKEPAFYDAFHTPHTLFAEISPALHKERRKMLNPYFSKQSVTKLDGIFYEKASALANKLTRLYNERKNDPVKPVDMYSAVRCTTVEVISEYAFGLQTNMIEESPNTFYAKFLETFDVAADLIIDGYHRPWALGIRFGLATLLPKKIVELFDPESLKLEEFQSYGHRCLQHNLMQNNESRDVSHPVIFDGLGSLPEDQLRAESVDILVAGSDTTAFSLSIGIYHILSNPAIKSRLVKGLLSFIPEISQMPRLAQLEEYPYLFACVKESLRFASAVPSILPRIVPDPNHVKGAEPLIIDGQLVPPGTIVGISAYTMHNSTELWGSDARIFNPERWLDDDGTVGKNAKTLEQSLCTFSKGARQCIGINVAHAEMFVLFAVLFRQFDLELPENFILPKLRDLFTQQVQAPGLLVRCKPRSG